MGAVTGVEQRAVVVAPIGEGVVDCVCPGTLGKAAMQVPSGRFRAITLPYNHGFS